MPELPEVETVRRGVDTAACGRRIQRVRVLRRDVVRGDLRPMAGQTLSAARRHGKQLALVTDTGPLACVHLGMSGSLQVAPARTPRANHVHTVWVLEGGLELRFRDPRRFGGVFAFPDLQQLHTARWNALGPDATVIPPAELHRRLASTTRASEGGPARSEPGGGAGQHLCRRAAVRRPPESAATRTPVGSNGGQTTGRPHATPVADRNRCRRVEPARLRGRRRSRGRVSGSAPRVRPGRPAVPAVSRNTIGHAGGPAHDRVVWGVSAGR